MRVPCHTWMLETLTMMMLLARPRPSQAFARDQQSFTPPAPSADDPRAEIARLHAEVERLQGKLAEANANHF
jgi:hypothetical protein